MVRALSTAGVVGAIAVAAVLVVGMAGATPAPSADPGDPALATTALIHHPISAPALVPPAAAATLSSSPSAGLTVVAPATSPSVAAPVPAAPVPSRTVAAAPQPAPAPQPALVTGRALPLGYATGTASRVITVVASSTASTTATLQAWNRAPGGGWLAYGAAVTAHVGAAGLTTHPSESLSATPIGSFTLTQAFGRNANPGTGLPYFQTTPNDWWVSDTRVPSLYNTHQNCAAGCSITQGDPNEHLYYETPYYNYAVVIDYNTPNAGPVVDGAGSAFFLHVTDGTPTAGCVSIPSANLVQIMQWLTPAASPRILIGVA
jgi:L,D-peptidoglycan transpeptidase YkuD (ErfK/YbiS/YcfS/YnhG family)